MADQPPPPAPTPDTPPAAEKKSPSPLGGLVIPLLLIAAAGVVFAVFYFLNSKTPPVDEGKLFDGYVTGAEKYGKLGDEYKDADGDLIADPPADAKEPAELLFTEIPGANPDADEAVWAEFLAHLSKATGKPCKYLKAVDAPSPPPPTPDDPTGEAAPAAADGAVKGFPAQLGALKAGQLHVTAFTTGQVRQAVNTAGFRPLVVPADKDGKFSYTVEILVPANSPAKELKDLKGKTLAVPSMSSNSGAKVPLMLLSSEGKLNPRTDLKVKVVGTARAALEQVTKGEADAASIASDLLARELARGGLTEDKFKRLPHPAAEYPRLCFGVSHALPQPLVDKIKAGFESFAFTGKVGERYQADGSVKFRPVSYKDDWKSVREVDDELARLLKGK